MIQTSERLKAIFFRSLEYHPTFYIYHRHPNAHNTPKEVLEADRRAARDIEELQKTIDDLTEYRTALAARYNELSTMPYTPHLELTRCRGYRGDSITYTVRIFRTYEDGTEAEDLCEIFEGKNRHKAIARYKELQKTHAGIHAEMKIEKSRWER